jgi:methyl-accepting chemotaxis protein
LNRTTTTLKARPARADVRPVPLSSDLVSQINQLAGDELGNARAELSRTRDIVTDAVKTLTGTFYQLAADSDAQRGLVQGLLVTVDRRAADSGDSALAIDGFIAETSATLQAVTASLRELGRAVASGTQKTDPMVAQMDSVIRVMRKLESIVEQSRILSINARIEAGRAGATGAAFVVVAGAMRDLAGYCADLNGKITAEVAQTRQLLDDVRGSLVQAAAQGLTQAATVEQRSVRLVQRLEQLSGSLQGELAKIEEVAGRVRDTVGAAVRCLQFADLVDQLLVSVDRRLERVEQAVSAQDRAGSDQESESAVARELAALRAAAADSCPVTQTSVTAGGVQLF